MRRRKNSLRLWTHDYAGGGWYFVTICTANRRHLFGTVVEKEMARTPWGVIASDCWLGIPSHFPKVQLSTFMVMPDHVHGLLRLHGNKDLMSRNAAAGLRNRMAEDSLGVVIRSYKSAVSREIHKDKDAPELIWQRAYHEHIIHDPKGLIRVRKYISNNPLKWNKP